MDAHDRVDTVRLLRFAYLLCRDRGHAEDLVQEALLKLHRRRGEPIVSPEAYARRTVVNEYLGWRRRAWFRELVTDAHAAPVVVAPGSTRHLPIDDVLAAIEELTPRQRTVIVLRFYVELPDDQIAEYLGVATATVRSTAARAMARIRARVVRPAEEMT